MLVNKCILNIVVCRIICKFAPNFEVYVHLMFTKQQSKILIDKGICYAKEDLYVHRFG